MEYTGSTRFKKMDICRLIRLLNIILIFDALTLFSKIDTKPLESKKFSPVTVCFTKHIVIYDHWRSKNENF